MPTNDLKYRVAWSRVPSIGPARFRMLERLFGDMERAWRAQAVDLQAAGLDQRLAAQVAQSRAKVDPDAEMARLEQAGARALSWHDDEYPRLLKEIADPPPVLFLKRRILPEDERGVTVVGTRRTTAYGREACQQIVQGLAQAGCAIVSGLARGIDAVAHRTALDNGARTIAVMGSGLDVMYPPEHRSLAEEIAAHGALVSELPMGTKPEASNFPRRNRILSGMVQACLVVEAPEDSGVMWTVRYALEQGRDVFAVPGSIFSPASRGANKLIQDGAKPILDASDILEEMNLFTLSGKTTVEPVQQPESLEEGEVRLLRLIGREPVHIDDVARRASLPVPSVSSTLALMELKGLVKQVGGMHFLRAREVPVAYQPS